MAKVFMKRILALALASMRFGTHIPSLMWVCSIMMREPASKCAGNPNDKGAITRASALIQPKSCLSIHSLPSTLANILPYFPRAW